MAIIISKCLDCGLVDEIFTEKSVEEVPIYKWEDGTPYLFHHGTHLHFCPDGKERTLVPFEVRE